jgi:signal transduction histidine kinase
MADNTNSAPVIKNEMERVLNLSELELDYSELNEYLQDLTNLAARVTNSEISLVNLIDSFTQWSVSRTGIGLEQMQREDSVCQYTITGDEGLEIQNLEKDERFNDKFYVTADPNAKYYFGIPLKTKEGNNIGALCVLDSKPKSLDPEKKELLKLIANEVIRRLEFLKENNKLREQLRDLRENQKKVSHDIRSPLSGIIGMTEIIKAELNPDQAENIIKMLTAIRQTGESLIDLADQVMMRDSEQKTDDEYTCSDFAQKLNKLYSPQAQSKKINLTINTDGSSIDSYPKNKLLQIVGNLISNSIKFTPEKGEVHVDLQTRKEEKDQVELFIKVADNGVGMDEETKDEILIGGKKSTEGTKGETGFGYGLSLVKHLIDKADGTFRISSKSGEGSTFRIVLPMK